MKSILILSFSGTGNTQFVVDALVKSLIEKGLSATSYPMEILPFEKNIDGLLSADMIGIAFPVHAFNPPPLVEKIIKQLPKTILKKCFILKTSGSPFAMGGTTSRLKSILTKRNWILKHEVLVPMPSNFIVSYTPEFIKLNLEMAIKQADKIAKDLIEENWSIIPAGKLAILLCAIMRIERIGAKFYGHYLKVGSNCIKCGKCVKNCSTRNIKFSEGKFTFGWKCTLCMRCSFGCPVQAYSHKHFGKLTMVSKPYNLLSILNNPGLKTADIMDDKIPNIKDFRRYWFIAGVLD